MQTEEDVDLGKQTGFTCVATFLPQKLEVHDFFSDDDIKGIEANKRKQRCSQLCCKGNFRKKHFWTLFIWKDKDSLRHFLLAEPRATAVKNFKVWAEEGSAFVEWTSESDTIDWTEVMKKLQNPTFYYKRE